MKTHIFAAANQSDGDSVGANKRVCFQFIGASNPNELRQTKSSGSAIRVNKNQSQKKRLTTHNSLKLLTRQLDSVVGHESDNQNQQITIGLRSECQT